MSVFAGVVGRWQEVQALEAVVDADRVVRARGGHRRPGEFADAQLEAPEGRGAHADESGGRF